ncbi:MAG: tetratricopeptide repeat protein [Ignavibacteriaceae bacterium]|nr:tetratricopeptide repeat protein [Ignavibacteriaceae bacterium]
MKIRTVITLILLSLCSTSFSQVDINNKIMLAQSFEQAGDFEKAASLYEEIYARQPQNYQIFESLNRVYIQSKKYAYSVKLIESKLKINPKDVNLYGMLGTTYYMMGDEQKAFEIWEDGINILPDNHMHYRIIANYAVQRRAFDKAIEYYKRGKVISQNPEMYAYDLANIYAITMRFREAAEEYCYILNIQPTQLSNVESRILSFTNKPGALLEVIDAVENWKNADNISFDYLLSTLYIEAKNYNKAYSIYSKIVERQQNKGLELYKYAQLIFNEGEYQLAAKVYEDIYKKYPESSYVSSSKLGYAKSLEAILDLEAMRSDAKWKPYYEPFTFDAAKVYEVIQSYEELIKQYPNSEIAYESYLRIGKVFFYKLNKLADASKYLNRLLAEASLSRFTIDASWELGKICLIEGNLDKAISNFERIINNGRATEENRNNARFQLARINLFEGNFQQAKERLNNIISNLKDNTANDAIELSLLLNTGSHDSSNLMKFSQAEFLIEQRKFAEASQYFRNISSDPNAFILHHVSKIREAETELAMNHIDKSIEILNNITAEAEKNIYADKALYLLGRIYQYGLKNYTKAIQSYEALLARFPNSVYQDDSRDAIIELRNKLS